MLRGQGCDLLIVVYQASAIIKCVHNLFSFITMERKEGDSEVLCETY